MGRFEMTDRERVLMNIAVDTAGTVHDQMKRLVSGWTLRYRFESPAPQFVPEELAKAIEMPLGPGDIVRCKTNPNHLWGISEFVERQGHAAYLLREIGGERTCNMGNESVDVLRFMPESRLYTGTKNRLYHWARGKAFQERYNPAADRFKRCGGVEFDGDVLIIWLRAHIWVMEKKPKDGPVLHAQPKKFTLKWSDKTRLKDIVGAMRDQGFADEFKYGPEAPTQGQAGYAKFTKADVERALQVSS